MIEQTASRLPAAILPLGVVFVFLMQMFSGVPLPTPAGQALAAAVSVALYLWFDRFRGRWRRVGRFGLMLMSSALAVGGFLAALTAMRKGLPWRFPASAVTAMIFHGIVATWIWRRPKASE